MDRVNISVRIESHRYVLHIVRQDQVCKCIHLHTCSRILSLSCGSTKNQQNKQKTEWIYTDDAWCDRADYNNLAATYHIRRRNSWQDATPYYWYAVGYWILVQRMVTRSITDFIESYISNQLPSISYVQCGTNITLLTHLPLDIHIWGGELCQH